MHGEAPETMETLRAALVKAHADNLALEHRATTAEAMVAALMAEGAATLAALRDAAVAEEREACARLCDVASAAWRDNVALPLAVRVNGMAAAAADAAAIRSRAPQEPPQRPEAPRDGATPAPDAPAPAGGLPVAATRQCPACNGGGRRLHNGWREVRCDECRTTGRVAAEGGGR